jgi:hypothetical protein
MRRFQLGLLTAALPALAFTLFLVGCSNEKKDTGAKGGSGETTETKQAAAGEVKVLEPKGGVLKGKITLKGSPDLAALTKQFQGDIAKKPDDKDYCMKGPESETTEQEYRIGDNKQLGNVFVWVIPDPGNTFFKVSKDQLEKAKSHPVKIRQPHCAFIPHASFLFSQYRPDPKAKAQPTGQILVVTNDAQIGHNTNWKGGARNPGSNEIIKAGKTIEVKDLVPEASPVFIKCNIHGWMDAYLRVVDTPYYAVSHSDTLDGDDKVAKGDEKFGTYEIKDLPAGKVRVLAWHEKAGWLNQGEGKGELIEIKDAESKEKNFEATAK